MWIRINHMRIRIRKILWMRIQDNKITKLITNHHLKVKKKYFFRFKLEKYNFLLKKPPKSLFVKLCFSLNSIPLDPHHWPMTMSVTEPPPVFLTDLDPTYYSKRKSVKKTRLLIVKRYMSKPFLLNKYLPSLFLWFAIQETDK